MAKLWTYIIICTGLMFLLKLAGIPTGMDWLLTTLGLSEDGLATNSQFVIGIGSLFALATVAGIAISFFTRGSSEFTILSTYAATLLALFLGTFASVINYMSSFEEWLKYPIILIFGVLGVGFVWATVEWVFGRDA